jgi:SPX domain protein involved in polyphosphate accumulation
MTSLLPNPRYERKFVTGNLSVAECAAILRRHPAGFFQAYPPRIVNNLYLDSAGLRSYHDHVDGAANRTKTRVRWYGPPAAHIERPSLERKLKRGLVSGKLVEALPSFSMNGEGVRATLEHTFSIASLPELLRLDLHHLSPTLFNRYHRYYFVSADRRFRLTIDSELQFAAPRTESTLVKLSSLPMVVLELKFAAEHLDAASVITNGLPLRMVRCSKYVLGIERISPS